MFKTLIASALAALVVAKEEQKKDSMIGVNIGGWQVIEQWITPTLFYRFLGKGKSDGIGTDSWSVCEVLGPVEGNKLMRAHWDSWITEDVIKALADREVEIVRLPIGDWTTKPYGPYVGCMDGAHDYIEWFMDRCHHYGIKVLLDIHAIKDSQNGFDNSGKMGNVEWLDEYNYKHWSMQAGNWLGEFDPVSHTYKNFKPENLEFSLDRVEELMQTFGDHPALYAFEPVNEPWEFTPLDMLFEYYRRGREIVRKYNPDVKFVFHSSFQEDANIWNNLFPTDDMENVIFDTHPYMAWDKRSNDIQTYCDSYKAKIASYANIKYPMWAGEWAFATDACAMWLDGMNDSKTPDQHPCEWIPCPKTYLPDGIGTDFDRTLARISPWGEDDKYAIQHGMCTTDSAFFTDEQVRYLSRCMFEAFDQWTDANFIWTARTEAEVKWDYVKAYDKGWMKTRKPHPAKLETPGYYVQ